MSSPTTNLMKSGLITFSSSFETFIECDTALLTINDDLTCDDKHVVFYVDADHPRHFRAPFLGATHAVRMRLDLCYYLLLTGQFVERGQPATRALAMLHFSPSAPPRRRVYLDVHAFERLFSGKSKHLAVDARNKAVIMRYHDDTEIGRVCFLRLASRRRRLSDDDLCVAERLRDVPRESVVVYEGRGWLWRVSA